MRVLDIAKMLMKWSGINGNTAVVVWVFMIEIFNREGFEYYAGVSNSTQAVVYNIILFHTGRVEKPAEEEGTQMRSISTQILLLPFYEANFSFRQKCGVCR